jgi:hypothetical protein
MTLSWSSVQPVGHCVAVGLSDGGHAGPLGNVLADQAVEVLIAAPFPRMVGGSEITLEREMLLELLVAVELGAVVEGDCLETGKVFCDSVQSGLCHGSGGSRLQLFDDGEAGLSFDEGENAVMAIAADHSVSLPVTELSTGFDGVRPLGNMPLAW